MSKSYGNRHGGKLTRILFGIDKPYESFLEEAGKKDMGICIGGGRGFSAKKPNAKLEGSQPDGEVKIIIRDGVWQVPAEERPKGWEEMGGKEKDV